MPPSVALISHQQSIYFFNGFDFDGLLLHRKGDRNPYNSILCRRVASSELAITLEVDLNSNLKLIGSDCDLSQFVGFKLNIKEGKHFIQNAFQTKVPIPNTGGLYCASFARADSWGL